jgi:hypothetical protein
MVKDQVYYKNEILVTREMYIIYRQQVKHDRFFFLNKYCEQCTDFFVKIEDSTKGSFRKSINTSYIPYKMISRKINQREKQKHH